MFDGFSQESVDFLWNIRFNNYRSWYHEHKGECAQYLDTPMRALAGQLYEALDKDYPELTLMTKVSRIYRDTRRLYGRPPYRDHMWLSIHCSQKSEEGNPSFYFELSPEMYTYGMGFWMASPRTMARLRQRIDQNPRPIEDLFRTLETRPEFRLDTVPYRRPKGDPGPLLFPVYNSRHVGIIAEKNNEGSLFTPDLCDELLDAFRFLLPFYRFFQDLADDQSPLAPDA